MRKTWLKIALTIFIILLIIIGVRIIRSTNKGTPNQSQKGNPIKKPLPSNGNKI